MKAFILREGQKGRAGNLSEAGGQGLFGVKDG